MNIGPNATHAGIILFSKYPKVLNTFSDSRFYKKSEVHYLIEDLSDKLKGRTFIDRALKAANNTLFTKEGGDRPKFPNALVLFTDGKTNKESKPYEEIIPSLKVSNGAKLNFQALLLVSYPNTSQSLGCLKNYSRLASRTYTVIIAPYQSLTGAYLDQNSRQLSREQIFDCNTLRTDLTKDKSRITSLKHLLSWYSNTFIFLDSCNN